MSGAVEWVFEIFLKLPMGFAIIKLKDKYKDKRLGFAKWALWSKKKLGVGHYQEKVYWTSREPKS